MVVSEGDESPAAGEKIMADLEQFMAECEALGKRSDRKRGKDKTPRVNSVELKTPKSADVVPVDLTKEEIEAVNAGIIASSLGPDSLCWKCLNAHDNVRHSCEKFKTGCPIDGSTYKQKEGPFGTEYNIRTCPCFKFEYDRPQPFRDIVKIIAHWCGVTTATVWRNRERFLAIYNEMCPECAFTVLDETYDEEEDEYDDDIIE